MCYVEFTVYQSNGKSKVWKRIGTAQDAKDTTSSMKRELAHLSSMMIKHLMVVEKINSEVYRYILSAQV